VSSLQISRRAELLFYIGLIASALAIFKIIVLFGERLKAAPPIGGQYQLEIPALLGCLPYRLDLQQSGVFLYGAIAPQPIGSGGSDPTARPTRPTLEGRWHNSSLSLIGSVDSACLQGPLQLTAQTKVGDRLQGQLFLSGRSLEFTGTRLAEPTQRPEH
jgi:hypothetical protein